MATTTTRLLLRKPDPNPVTGDFVDVQADLNANYDKIDAAIGAVSCTSGARPSSPYVGQFARETDTGNLILATSIGPAVWNRVLMMGDQRWPNILAVERAVGDVFTGRQTGDSGARVFIRNDGMLIYGDGAGSTDTNLYRNGSGTLKTDGILQVAGALQALGALTITGTTTANGTTNLTGDFQHGGVGMPRAFLDYVDSTSADSAHTTETASLTGNTVTFVNNRCYEVEFAGNMATATAANFAQIRVRKTNAAGTFLGYFQYSLASVGPQYYVYGKMRIKRTAGSNLSANLCLTSQGSAGNLNFTGATTDVRYLHIKDCGPSSQFTNAIAIT